MTAQEKIVQAYLIPGANPAYHHYMVDKLHREWPTLAKAIEELVEESK